MVLLSKNTCKRILDIQKVTLPEVVAVAAKAGIRNQHRTQYLQQLQRGSPQHNKAAATVVDQYPQHAISHVMSKPMYPQHDINHVMSKPMCTQHRLTEEFHHHLPCMVQNL